MSNITYGIPQHQKRMPGKDKLRITITTLPDMQQLRVLIQFFLLHKQADRSQEHLFDVRQRNEGEQIKSHTQDVPVVYLKTAPKKATPFLPFRTMRTASVALKGLFIVPSSERTVARKTIDHRTPGRKRLPLK